MIDRAPHFLLDHIAGWRQAGLTNTVLSGRCEGLTLQLLQGAVRPLVDAAGSFGGFETAIGVAIDSQDRIYVLDGHACTVKRFDRCAAEFVTLPCVGGPGDQPRKLNDPHGLAISSRNDMYIADTGNRRIQIFSIQGLALRSIWGPIQVSQSTSGFSIAPVVPSFPAATSGTDCAAAPSFPQGTWQPWDIALSRENKAFVSDYANGLIHVFDSRSCWLAAYNGATAAQPPLSKPTRVALDCEGRVYVLQENIDYVVVLDSKGQFLGRVDKPEEIKGRFQPVAAAVDIDGNLCLSDCLTRRVYFFRPDRDGGWCSWRCCGSAEAFAASLVFDRSQEPVLADGAHSICQLERQGEYPAKGYYYAGPLDSRTYRCVWHRVVLSGSVPLGSAVVTDTFTSESTKTPDEILALPESRWATRQRDTSSACSDWDCLIQSPPGRYLWLRLTLAGDGSVTPALTKVKVYYPRASSLQYLPGVYREDAVASDFLDRFLSLFDTIRGQTSELITDIRRYFDPKATPAIERNVFGVDFLSWLGSWLGMTLKSNWTVRQRRELVRQAHRLYALRGTPEGLRLHVELYTGLRPAILELFQLRRWLIVGQSTLGNCSSVFGTQIMQRLQIGSNSRIGKFRLIDFGDPQWDLFNEYAYRFLVVVPRWPGAGEAEKQTLEEIIEMAKPAHTIAELRWAEPRLRVGIQSFVGVDTVIGKYPLGVIAGQGTLGYDTVLGTPGQQQTPSLVKVGNSRVGTTTRLN